MSNHEATLAHLDNELEKLDGQRREVEGRRLNAQAALERLDKELNLIDYQIKEYKNTKSCLAFDRAAAKIDANPQGLRVMKDQPQA